MLTKGLDNVAGTSGNDTIIGSIDNSGTPNVELNTLSTLDIVNGGAGVDTLSINVTGGATVNLPNMTNVEIVNVESTAGATVDTSAVAGVTNLNVTKVGVAGAVKATGATTTDVNVSMKAAGAQVEALGGKDVTVKLTDVDGNNVNKIAVGDVVATGSVNAPKGNVVVEATAKAADTVGGDISMGDIAVTGGKSISVTQKAGANNLVADGAAIGGTPTTHTMGNVKVTANSDTTTVTLKQDAAATAENIKAVTKVDEVATVTFTKLDSGQSATVGGLTFQASKDLTAEQVAKAFANLSASAIKPTDVTSTTAAGDTNGGDARADGVFTGALLAKWSSAAASGNTVTFTASGAMGTDLAASGTGATAVTNTQGVDAVTGKNTLGVTNGVVAITGGAALKTVTVDGYAYAYATSATKGTNGIIGTTNTVLDTINLANGTGFVIESAAAALALDLKNVNGTVDVDAGTKTLNVSVSHAKATDTATLAANEATSVKVTGTGNVAGTTGVGANQLDAATSIDTTGMTAGKATFTIANGTVTTYAGGAGVDKVTISNADTAITKAIDLGAGDDTLTLNGVGNVNGALTATLNGGAGTDILEMTAASAVALSANATFEGKIDGFEKLSVGNAAAVGTVNLANMDDINYVITAGSAGGAIAEVQTFAVTAGTTAATGESQTINFANLLVGTAGNITVGGVTVALAAGDNAAAIGAKVAAALTAVTTDTPLGNATVTDDSAGLVTVAFTAAAGAQPALVVAADTAVVRNTANTAADAVVAETVANVGPGTGESQTIDFTNLVATTAGNITVGGKTVALAQGDDGATIAGKVAAALTGQALTAPTTVAEVVAASATGAVVTVDFTFVTGAVNDITVVDTSNVVDKIVNVNTATVADNFVVYNAGGVGNIVIEGVNVAVTAGMTADQVGAAIAAANYSATTIDTVTYNTGTDTVTVTYKAGVNEGDTTTVAGATGVTFGAVGTTTQGAATGGTAPALTLDKMANNGTVELTANGAGVIVKMADATGSTDSFNIVTKVVAAPIGFGTVDVAGVETLKLNALDTQPTVAGAASIQTATLDIKADKATSLTIEGNSNVALTLDATTNKLATIDAGTLTGALDFAANGVVAMTITGGKGNDVLKASIGATAKADVINGGEGNDTLTAGTNGAKLTGGAGNDLFIVTATAATDGNKESNTYSEILDFQAGDVLQLQYSSAAAAADVTGFTKLAAVLNENTAGFSDFVNAAIKEAGAGAAVYFNFKGDAYIAIDSATSTDAFVNGEDMVVKLTGINGDNLSFNSDFATVALI